MSRVTPPTKPAPDDLRLVQDVVNSRDIEAGVDAWADAAALAAWLERRGFGAGATAADLRRATALREALRALLWANNEHPLDDASRELLAREAEAARVRVRFDGAGRASLQPAARGVDGLVEAVMATVATAMLDGRWPRLKACWNEECRYAFYDATRNRSGRWCTMSRCGTQLAARAYRRRRRGARPRPARAGRRSSRGA